MSTSSVIHISLIHSNNLDNLEVMFIRYYIHNDICSMFKVHYIVLPVSRMWYAHIKDVSQCIMLLLSSEDFRTYNTEHVCVISFSRVLVQWLYACGSEETFTKEYCNLLKRIFIQYSWFSVKHNDYSQQCIIVISNTLYIGRFSKLFKNKELKNVWWLFQSVLLYVQRLQPV